MADVELRSDIRRAVSHGVHAKIPLERGRQHEHRLAGSALLPAKPGGGAARRNLANVPERSLHHALPLPKRGRLRFVSQEVGSAGSLKLDHELVSIDPHERNSLLLERNVVPL